jgi:hypothetical protein
MAADVQSLSEMRHSTASRALILLLCVALVLCLALNFSGSQLQWAIIVPFLIAFVFPSVRARISSALPIQFQPLSLLSSDGSRAPPLD